MAVATLKFITEDEYLALEENAEVRHEYYNGQIFAIAGGTPEHSLITTNVSAELRAVARGRGCNTHSTDLRIRVEKTGLHTYPDVSVICGPLKLSAAKPQAATNPTVLVEVLSDSTASYDRGEKWRHYQTIESLTDYVLVSQDRPCIEVFSRQPGGGWEYHLYEGMDSVAELRGIPAALKLSEVYLGVEFGAPESLRDPTPETEDEF